MDKLARLVDHPRLVIGVVALLTAFFAFFARNARIDSSVATLVDPDSPEVAHHREVQKLFASDEIDIVLVVADDVFVPATLEKIRSLSERMAAIRGVAEVSSIATERSLSVTEDGDIDDSVVMDTVPTSAEDIARLRARIYANPLLVDNLVGADGTGAAILVRYERMPEAAFAASGIHDEIDRILDQAQGPERIFFTGIPMALK